MPSSRLAPSQLRLALLLLVWVYPVITIYLYVIMPLTPGWALWQRTLVLVPLMVATITFVLMPFIHRRFGGFIAGKAAPQRSTAEG